MTMPLWEVDTADCVAVGRDMAFEHEADGGVDAEGSVDDGGSIPWGGGTLERVGVRGWENVIEEPIDMASWLPACMWLLGTALWMPVGVVQNGPHAGGEASFPANLRGLI